MPKTSSNDQLTDAGAQILLGFGESRRGRRVHAVTAVALHVVFCQPCVEDSVVNVYVVVWHAMWSLAVKDVAKLIAAYLNGF